MCLCVCGGGGVVVVLLGIMRDVFPDQISNVLRQGPTVIRVMCNDDVGI